MDISEVRKIAALARLDLTGEELKLFAGQMGAILGYVERIGKLPLDGVEPLSQVQPLFNVMRKDEPAPSVAREEVLREAPESSRGFYRVPRILE